MKRYFLLLSMIMFAGCSAQQPEQDQNKPTELTIATFNVSMEAQNYASETEDENATPIGPQVLMAQLASGENSQIQNIAEIIQRTRPDIILLNEFDFIDDPKAGVEAFINNYLQQPQQGRDPIDYPYYFYGQVNTGLPTLFDLNNDGKRQGYGADAQGFGLYPGHYGMVLLSRYPLVREQIRTFQRFLWADMPDAMAPIDPATQAPFFTAQEWHSLRLSSKSHWDVPVEVNGQVIHVLASHPTPPVFDGDEDRNGRRNHDEIRFWLDYISPGKGDYIYDDRGIYGGIEANSPFVILGDQNASPDRPNDTPSAIKQLLASPYVNSTFTPTSAGGKLSQPDNGYAQYYTANWGARADYVLPSSQFTIEEGAVFWPSQASPLYRLVEDRSRSSDHRLVWLTIALN
ncbi:endonuclease/exonuclease/phosphatase family protein [Alteromonas sp. C1M14]|uniref:endonuclease/exonuclease/phosphatase family protein n=1 Tax=Alteromonas sp. C1M14 TaxID=2841567 RepID=UPI001C092727|nr:endonuclease/exonuclease/phosphatase family protein [Alteromonas sp. C1M14]MBU2978612.1 endonuclease/exonuclease/phosphatase family protein [Alteromonas sp. C1M14]